MAFIESRKLIIILFIITLQVKNGNCEDEEFDVEYENEISEDDLEDKKVSTVNYHEKLNGSDHNYKSQTKNRKLSESQMKRLNQWMKDYKRHIVPKDLEAIDNFFRNDERIRKFNEKKDKTYSQGHNKYSDRSFADNKALRTGLKIPKIADVRSGGDNKRQPTQAIDKKISEKGKKLPKYVNHRRSMGPVKDQKDCGACYAFAAAGIVEFLYRSKDWIFTLSEQDIVDCDILSFGCEGGWPTKALTYISAFGVASGLTYKYANSKQMCLRKHHPPIADLANYNVCEKFLNGNETELKILVAERPVIVGFSITVDFMYYKSGIFSDKNCKTDIDHALIVVGYSTDKKTKKDYWIVKNSWGVSWGMLGYAHIQMDKNMCGIGQWAMTYC